MQYKKKLDTCMYVRTYICTQKERGALHKKGQHSKEHRSLYQCSKSGNSAHSQNRKEECSKKGEYKKYEEYGKAGHKRKEYSKRGNYSNNRDYKKCGEYTRNEQQCCQISFFSSNLLFFKIIIKYIQ